MLSMEAISINLLASSWHSAFVSLLPWSYSCSFGRRCQSSRPDCQFYLANWCYSRCRIWSFKICSCNCWHFLTFLMATAHTGEKARDTTWHWLTYFPTLGLPDTIKIDKGPAYASVRTRHVLTTMGCLPQVSLTLPLVRLLLNVPTEH